MNPNALTAAHRHSGANIVCAVIVLAALGCRASLPASPSPEAALRAVSEAYNGAPDTKDANAIVRYFSDDVVVMSPQGRTPVRGIDANRAAWERFFRGGNPVHTMTTDTVAVAEGGDLGYTLGHWTVGVDTPGGRAEATGEYLAVWRKKDGIWKIVALSVYTFRQAPASLQGRRQA